MLDVKRQLSPFITKGQKGVKERLDLDPTVLRYTLSFKLPIYSESRYAFYGGKSISNL